MAQLTQRLSAAEDTGEPLNWRWIPKANWHLTVRFLGSIEPLELAQIQARLAELAQLFPPVVWRGEHMSYLPSSSRPKVWAVEGTASADLQGLYDQVANTVTSAAGDVQTYAHFRPHISLMRFANKAPFGAPNSSHGEQPLDISGLLDLTLDFSAAPITVCFEEMGLFESQLDQKRGSPVYLARGVWRLAGQGAQ